MINRVVYHECDKMEARVAGSLWAWVDFTKNRKKNRLKIARWQRSKAASYHRRLKGGNQYCGGTQNKKSPRKISHENENACCKYGFSDMG